MAKCLIEHLFSARPFHPQHEDYVPFHENQTRLLNFPFSYIIFGNFIGTLMYIFSPDAFTATNKQILPSHSDDWTTGGG